LFVNFLLLKIGTFPLKIFFYPEKFFLAEKKKLCHREREREREKKRGFDVRM
jgi:hypothetical protein